MSDAFNCPLLYQLNSLQIQPLQSYNSCDTELDPDDILPSDFNHDEPIQTNNDYLGVLVLTLIGRSWQMFCAVNQLNLAINQH